MRWILVQPQPPFRPCDGPEIVESIPRRCRNRMIPIRQEDGIAVADRMRDGLAVGRIQHLMAEAVRGIDPEVIDLFEHRFTIAAVMLVRWIAAPVAGRVE